MTMERKRRCRTRVIALCAVALAALAPAATQAQAPDPAPVAAAPVTADSAALSAKSALIRSLVLPGWGQAYVGAHGRGAFYFALETGSLWMLYKSNRSLADAREIENYLREIGTLAEGQRLALAESRAQQVEDWITLSIFWALFAGADAYVSAQLSDFVGHVGAQPGADGGLQVQVNLPVGRPR